MMKKIVLVFVALLLISGGFFTYAIWQLSPPDLRVPEKKSFLVKDITVVQAGSNRLNNIDIWIKDGTVKSLLNTDKRNESFEGEILDEYRTYYVSPGLIDMHVHFPPDIAIGNPKLFSLLYLAHGVTTVRDMGSIDGNIFKIRKGIQQGKFPGPRVFTAGKMIDGEPSSFPSNLVVRNVNEATEAVRKLKDKGVDFIKVYNTLAPESFYAIQEEAKKLDLPVLGHVPHAVGIDNALLDDVQHLTGVPVFRDKTIRAYDYLMEDLLTIDSARMEYIADLSVESDMAHTPTLINLVQRQLLNREFSGSDLEEIELLPDFWLEVWKFIWGSESPTDEHIKIMKQTVNTLNNKGVRIHGGTDTMMPFVIPGSSLQKEIGELVDAGLTLEEAWMAVTTIAGNFLPTEGLGTIQTGNPADLLIFSEDPMRSLNALNSLEAVIADGRLYTKEELTKNLDIYQAHFHSNYYSFVMNTLTSMIKDRYSN